MLQNNAILKGHIDNLWRTLWSGGIANPLTAIEQITYLLFMKRLDDIELRRERDAKLKNKIYKSRFSGTFVLPGSKQKVRKSTLRWSYFTKIESQEELLVHIQSKVFPFLKELNGDTSPFTKHMSNAVFVMPKASLLVESIKIIESIYKEIQKDAKDGGHAFQDIQGDVYEMLLSEIATAGKMGQFRTPRHIIKLIAELVEPRIGEYIADPACGTGGFLLGAYQYILTDLAKTRKKARMVTDEDGFERYNGSAVLSTKEKSLLQVCIHGYDIDQTMVRLGLMNLMMHGIDEPQIEYQDTLSKKFSQDYLYDLIVANPPFTGSIDKSDLFENRRTTTSKTELLFLDRIFNMLKLGGRAAVIVPQGVLFSTSKAFIEIRKMLIEEADLKAVICMPSGVFKPYAGVATAILVFTKAEKTKDVWFFDMKADGYSLDDKRNKISESDLPNIVKQFRSKRRMNSDRRLQHFLVSSEEIVENNYDLTFDKYRIIEEKPFNYESPQAILGTLTNIERNIEAGINELSAFLNEHTV